jgi:protein O-GlcNAc transferase
MRLVLPALLFAILPSMAQAPAHAGNAVRLMQDRRYADAAKEFELALAADPNNDPLRIQYATCLYAQQRDDDARKQFEAVRQHVGERPGIGYYLGLLDLRANNFAAAIAKLQPLELNPTFPKASFYLGMAYLGAGKTSAAVESLQRAAENNPHDADVHYRLARAYTMEGRTAEADREYQLYRKARESERVVEEDVPACVDALRTQPVAQARETCEKIADPEDSGRLILLGQLYSQAGDFADAIDPLERAAKLAPESFEAWHFLGLSLFGLKRYPEARGPLTKAAALNPQYFDTVNLLAKTLYAMGDYAAALPVLEQAHNLNPADTQLAGVLERLRASLGKR